MYARAKLFTGEPLRAVRAPSIERRALARLLAQLGRLNFNVYPSHRRQFRGAVGACLFRRAEPELWQRPPGDFAGTR